MTKKLAVDLSTSSALFAEEDGAPKPWNPLPRHLRGMKFLLSRAHGGLFAAPGAGKTSITYAVFQVLQKEGQVERLLVLCSKNAATLVWPAEARKWTDFAGLKVVVLHGAKKDKLLLEENVDVFVCTYDGVDWLLRDNRFLLLKVDMLAVDELQRYKHPRTSRFKNLRLLLPRFRRRIGLTGSPAARNLLDLFGECYVLDEGRSLGRYITHFRSEYFRPTGYGGYTWTPNPGAEEKIYKRLEPLALRIGDEELGLPDVAVNPIYVELPKAARKAYDSMEDDLLAKVRGGTINASNSGAASGKCRQMASGAAYTGAKREWLWVHSEKIEALKTLIDELQGQPLLVAYEYDHERERLLSALGKNTACLSGGTSGKRIVELEREWNRGNLPVLLGQTASIALSLNLQEGGSNLAWFTLTHNYEFFDQLVRRLRRPGQRHATVQNHLLLARDTVDLQVRYSLGRKQRGQDALFEALQHRAGVRAPRRRRMP